MHWQRHANAYSLQRKGKRNLSAETEPDSFRGVKQVLSPILR